MATPLPVFLLELTASQAALNPVTERITNKFGDRVVHDGIKNAPKLSGSLRGSIKRQPALAGKGAVAINVTAGGPSEPHDVDYAVYVHDGTSRMAPRPFLRNAFNSNLPKFEKEMADVMALLHAGRPGRAAGSIGR